MSAASPEPVPAVRVVSSAAGHRDPMPDHAGRVRAIDALLPQTQCTRCGYPACLPYAEAIATGEADINRCPPGGDDGIRALAALLARAPVPLDPSRGAFQPQRVARIDEGRCIGCTLCIQACPVDAIIGGPKHMHVVIADWCTGCDLCVPPCPVDCITMVPAATPEWGIREADAARHRYQRRQRRLERTRIDPDGSPGSRAASTAGPILPATHGAPDAGRRQAVVRAAIERARAKRAARA